MLVLTRKVDQGIEIPGAEISIRVLDVQGNRVRLGITAPEDVAIFRDELYQSTLGGEEKSPKGEVEGSRMKRGADVQTIGGGCDESDPRSGA